MISVCLRWEGPDVKQLHAQHAKTCSRCQKTYEELYDCYSDTCPECTLEDRGTLTETEGGWVWEQP
jgi:hypothetical protein